MEEAPTIREILLSDKFWLFSFLTILQLFMGYFLYNLLFQTNPWFISLKETKNVFLSIGSLFALFVIELIKERERLTKIRN